MYSAVTAFEVDVDHNQVGPEDLILGLPGGIILGTLAAGEIIGVLLIFAGRDKGFTAAISAEIFRAIAALLAGSAPASYAMLMAVINTGILSHLRFRPEANSEGADVGPASSGTDAGPPAAAPGDRAGNLDVFLSYSRRQFYFAESLMLRLERKAVSVWFDAHQIQAGADWRESIDRGLSACTSLVLVASRDALASANVEYEWRTALESGKRIYVLLFEAVELPHELSLRAEAIIDMRTRFQPKVTMLVDLLAHPCRYRDKTPKSNRLRLPVRQPPSTLFVMTTLVLILAVSLFIDFLNVRTLVAIVTPHEKNIPERSDESFTTHLFGLTFHGLSSKVYAFLGITAVTLLLTTLTAFLLVAILRRQRFHLALLPLALLGSSWLYLNTSFINHSTNHVIVSISGSLMSMPGNLHSSAWRDLDDIILGKHVEYSSSWSFDHGSPFLSVGDARPYLTTVSAHWRWPTLLLLILAAIAFLAARRSRSLYRWLATGVAPEKLRFRHNESPDARRRRRRGLSALIFGPPSQPRESARSEAPWSGDKEQQAPPGTQLGQPPRARLLHHPADGHIAAEIETALAERSHAGADHSEPRDVAVVLLTTHTQQAWLEGIERENPDLVCVLCTNIQPVETLKLLRRNQWFDYRERSYDKLTLLAHALQKSPSRSAGYSFPALPERLTKMVIPGPVWFKSHAMRLCATWLLAITLFGEGRIYSSFVHEEGLGRLFPVLAELMFWICIPCCLYLFWLAVELASSRTAYVRFQRRLNTVVVVLFVTQLQFLLCFDDQLGTVLLGTLINLFLTVAWRAPDAAQIRRWLPAHPRPATGAGTLAVPLRNQFALSTVIYLALFAFCYWSGVIFFADAA
ncbi:toll/interleukin-1 receptor domain-containing protein [Streptomyces spectabilis]|uniref:toll/interleukin-1 receptor domain-containing protein n=1 Tax=Streptomyces spectabilis TaxID=68270 RepID=UPI0033F76CBD